MKCPFENFYGKFEAIADTPEWARLQEDFNQSEYIYVVGNGGNMAVASHAAADVTRLTGKKTFCLDSQSLMTSFANDFGYDNIFARWLNFYAVDTDKKSMVLGYSGSGNSKNVLGALDWAHNQHNFSAHLFSGVKSLALSEGINEIVCDMHYFHTHEIMSVMTFYELVYGSGNECPTIRAEVNRKFGTINTDV